MYCIPSAATVHEDEEGPLCVCLQDVLQMLGQRADAPWGVHFRIHTQQLLEASLKLLNSTYGREELYRPVWVSMEGVQTTDQAQVWSILPG